MNASSIFERTISVEFNRRNHSIPKSGTTRRQNAALSMSLNIDW